MELKTLKDLRARKTHTDAECVNKDFLRKEAIKWIKELDKDMKEIRTNPQVYQAHMAGMDRSGGQQPEYLLKAQHQILWIKHFFNITEEDLK